jgi:hypothetical protein
MMTVHSAKIRTKWKSATTPKITPAAKENVFSSMSDHQTPSSVARWFRQSVPMPLELGLRHSLGEGPLESRERVRPWPSLNQFCGLARGTF